MAISGLQVIDIGLQNESTGSDSLYTAFNKTKNIITWTIYTPRYYSGLLIPSVFDW